MIKFPIIRITEAKEALIGVNMNNVVSYAIERKVPERKLKEAIRQAFEEKTLKRNLKDEDYETVGYVDRVSFYFIGGTGLTYIVGKEITKEDFIRIVNSIKRMEFILERDNKISSTDKTA